MMHRIGQNGEAAEIAYQVVASADLENRVWAYARQCGITKQVIDAYNAGLTFAEIAEIIVMVAR